MVKIPLVSVAFLALLFTGLSLGQSWFAARPSPQAEVGDQSQDSLAAWRHRQGLARHWRALMVVPR